MSFSGHSLPDKSSSATARLQRACYHYSLYRVKDENGKESWFCEDCDAEFNLTRVSAVNQKESTNANLRKNQGV